MATLSRGVNRDDTMMRINSVYAIMPKITDAVKPGMLGGECFIVGGGPSLANFDFNRLKGKNTIGINKTFMRFSPTINYSMDVEFYNKLLRGELNSQEDLDLLEKWKQYKGIKVLLSPMNFYKFDNLSELYFVRRILEHVVSTSPFDGIYAGNNSGFGATMLAAALGARKIYLLGFDMQTKDNKTHWHKGYQGGEEVTAYNERLKKYATEFADMVPLLDEKCIQVINVNDEDKTSLRCFPIISADFIL